MSPDPQVEPRPVLAVLVAVAGLPALVVLLAFTLPLPHSRAQLQWLHHPCSPVMVTQGLTRLAQRGPAEKGQDSSQCLDTEATRRSSAP
jgi:hypothetical protein